jgi:hypothetical protein
LHRATLWNCWKQAVDLRLWNAMMAARSLDGLDLAFVDPLLQRGIAYAQDLAGIA